MKQLSNKPNCTQLSTQVCKSAQKSLLAKYLNINGLGLQLCNKLHTFAQYTCHVLFLYTTAQKAFKSTFFFTKQRNRTKTRRFLGCNCAIVFFYTFSGQKA